MNYRCTWNDPFLHVSDGPLTVFFPAVTQTRVGSLSRSRQQLFKPLCKALNPHTLCLGRWDTLQPQWSHRKELLHLPFLVHPHLSVSSHTTFILNRTILSKAETPKSLITSPPVSPGSMTSKLSPGLPSPLLFFFFFLVLTWDQINCVLQLNKSVKWTLLHDHIPCFWRCTLAISAPHPASWKVVAFARFGSCHHCQADSALSYLLRMLWWLSTHQDLLQSPCRVGCGFPLPTYHLKLYLPVCVFIFSFCIPASSPGLLLALLLRPMPSPLLCTSFLDELSFFTSFSILQTSVAPDHISEPQLPKLCQFPTGQSSPCPMGQLSKI